MSVPTFAARDEARAYVARVLSRPAPASPRPVYLIMPPDMPASPAWARLAPVLPRILPGAEVLTFADVFKGAPGIDKRLARLRQRVGGALVIPRAWRAEGGRIRHLLGYAARAEALGLLEAGLPVLVLTPAGVVAWPDVKVRAAGEGAPASLPLEIEFPAPPEGELLPTVAASYRALGLPRPRPRRGPRRREARAELAPGGGNGGHVS